MKTGERPCSAETGLWTRPRLRVVSSADRPAALELFTCGSCDETYPKAADMNRDGKGDFLDETCPDCYHEILATEGIIPNAAEARRMGACRAVIAAFRARKRSP